MSADPFVQAPYNSQSYNRYSYVFNNPLSFTDPSGYTCVGTGYAPGACGSDSNTEQTRVYCDYACQEAARLKRDAQQNAIKQSNIASWRASESRDQHWAYMNGAAYNIANIWGMTEFALAAGGYFPNALKKELFAERPVGILTLISVLDSPVGGAPITSEYGANRTCPQCSKTHRGTDFRVPVGTRVVATYQGQVVFAGNNRDYGNMVIIYHGGVKNSKEGLYTLLAHGKSLSVKAGDYINTGQKVMTSGSSGKSSGPHVHYEIITSKTGPVSNGFFAKSDQRYGRFELQNLVGF